MEIKDKEMHRIVTTAIIYNDKGQFLITKRSPTKKVHPNLWTVAGGGLTVDDYINIPITHGASGRVGSIETALRREVKEEVGVEIEKPQFLLDVTFIRPDGVPVLVLSYSAKYKSGKVALDEDATEYAWVTVDDLSKYKFIKGIDEEIKMVHKNIWG